MHSDNNNMSSVKGTRIISEASESLVSSCLHLGHARVLGLQQHDRGACLVASSHVHGQLAPWVDVRVKVLRLNRGVRTA